MTNLIKAILAGSALIAVAGTASADETFTADFTFTVTDSAEVIHAQFKEIAKDACRVSMREAGGLAVKYKIESACRAQLMDDAVTATQHERLIAYHKQGETPELMGRQFAEVD